MVWSSGSNIIQRYKRNNFSKSDPLHPISTTVHRLSQFVLRSYQMVWSSIEVTSRASSLRPFECDSAHERWLRGEERNILLNKILVKRQWYGEEREMSKSLFECIFVWISLQDKDKWRGSHWLPAIIPAGGVKCNLNQRVVLDHRGQPVQWMQEKQEAV